MKKTTKAPARAPGAVARRRVAGTRHKTQAMSGARNKPERNKPQKEKSAEFDEHTLVIPGRQQPAQSGRRNKNEAETGYDQIHGRKAEGDPSST